MNNHLLLVVVFLTLLPIAKPFTWQHSTPLWLAPLHSISGQVA